MQNKKIIVSSIGVLLSIVVTSSFANKEWCPPDTIHCAYISGLSNNIQDGRFIKLINKKINAVLCFNFSSSVSITNKVAGQLVGANADQYFICSDASGNNCEPIGIDQFEISKSVDQYVAAPKFYNIDLSEVKNKYPTCSSNVKIQY